MTTITRPVLKEARRLLDWYESDDSDPDQDTALNLTDFVVRPALASECEKVGGVHEDTFAIAIASVENHGPLGEVTGQHDDIEYLTGSGMLLSHVSDGVEQVARQLTRERS